MTSSRRQPWHVLIWISLVLLGAIAGPAASMAEAATTETATFYVH